MWIAKENINHIFFERKLVMGCVVDG